MPWQNSASMVPLGIAAATAATLARLVWRRRPAAGAVPLTWLMLAVAEWSLGYALELGSGELLTKVLWAKVEYVGIVSVLVAWLVVALQYTGRDYWLVRRNLILLALLPLVTLVLTWTNGAHGLIWSAMSLARTRVGPVLDVTYGAWFWVHTAYSYFLLLTGSVLLVGALVRSSRLYRGQAGVLLIGVLLPWLANGLYLARLSPVPHLDLTPFAFTASGLLLVWGLFYYRLLDIAPVARDAVVESLRDGVIALDAQRRVVDLNVAAQRLIGMHASAVIGRSAAQVIPAWRDVIAGEWDGGAARPEIALGDGDGRRVYEPQISPLYDRHGRLTGQLLVLHDITERKQVEEERARLAGEQAARAAAEQAADRVRRLQEVTAALSEALTPEQVAEVVVMQGVAALDASAGSIAGLSRDGTQLEVVRAVGYPPELLEAYRCFPLAAPMPLADAVRTGELILLESPAVRAARYPHLDTSSAALSPWRAWASIPLKVEGRTVGAMGLSFVTARDFSADDCDLMLTLGRQCAQALERARLYGEAREAIRARDVFLSLASHELKTPLATLQGHAELLLRRVRGEASGDERLYRSARSIYEQAVRLHRLIDLLLDFSHLQTGQLRIEHKPVDLCTLARRLIEILEPTLKQHRLDLYCPDEPLLVEGDEVRLTEVLQNLINNAIKYSPAGGPVTVRLERQDEQARLIVADQGFGVPAEALGQIFGRFYRAPNVDPQQISGLGLGLAVVKEVVILHGGTIEVESKEGGGSTFTVVLPLLAGAQRGSGNQEDKHREEPPALEPGRE